MIPNPEGVRVSYSHSLLCQCTHMQLKRMDLFNLKLKLYLNPASNYKSNFCDYLINLVSQQRTKFDSKF